MFSSENVSTSIVEITPQKAKEMLAMSSGNRPLKRAKVESYARDMASGNWQVNGEPIIIDEDGTLVDGHHRLKSVEKSGCAITSLVVKGVKRESRFTIDMGASRSISDAVSFEGVLNANLVASISRSLMSLSVGSIRSSNPSSQEVFSYIKENPTIEGAASFAATKHMSRCATLLGTAYVVDPDEAVYFGDVLKTGIPHYKGCAAHRFREVIISANIKNGGSSIKLGDFQLLFVSAFEKFRKRSPVKKLQKATEFRMNGWPK